MFLLSGYLINSFSMKKVVSFIVVVLAFGCALFLTPSVAVAENPPHCEVPCGIYGDSVRIALIYEHIETIDKSMKMIEELSNQSKPNYNQLVRWVVNKEEHAEKIQKIVSQYFLHQRVKIKKKSDGQQAYQKYITQLQLLHQISVYAMKAKQSTNRDLVDTLKAKVHEFEHVYFGEHHHH